MARPSKGGTCYMFYSNSKNRWVVDYTTRDPATGVNKRVSRTFSTEKEAKDYYSTIQYQKGNALFVKNNGIPLNELMKANLERKYNLNQVGDTQYSRVLKSIKKLEEVDLFKRRIEDISSEEIQEYLNSLKEHYSNSTIKKFYEQIKQAFEYAINKGYLTRNPLVDVVKPRSAKKDKVIRAMDLDEENKFYNYLLSKSLKEEPYKNVYLLQLFCGLRVGEALALRIGDIDLRKNLVYVNKTLTRDKDEKVVMGEQTKTYAGMREVPIPEFIKDSIMEQMILAENNKDKQLFMTSNDNYVNQQNVNRLMQKTLKKIGITGISTHSLRHTFGTRCVEAGMRAVALQRLMGHTDISTTLNTYTTIFNKYKETELEKVNEYYMKNVLSTPIVEIDEGNIKLLDDIGDDELTEKEGDKDDKERD